MTTYWKCCPVPCFDDCCEWWDGCDPQLPTSVSVTFKKKCTRRYYDGNLVFLSSTTIHDTNEVYTATNWSLQTIPGQCGEDGLPYFKSDTINYTLTGYRKYYDPIGPVGVGDGVGICGDGNPFDACNICDANYNCESFPSPLTWCWDPTATYDVDGIIPDYFAEFSCCEIDGCFRPCLNFAPGTTDYYLDGTVNEKNLCPCSVPLDQTYTFTTTHNFFQVAGRCGCLGPDSWTNIKLGSFFDQWGATDFGYSGYYKWSTDSGIQGGAAAGYESYPYCECVDYSVSPPQTIRQDCGYVEWYVQDICEYELIVVVT
jgi:hypothetical protein